MSILLVEPEFPIPSRSRNHKNFLPIGLLKLASYYKSKNQEVKLIRGNKEKRDIQFIPSDILVTSLFTYWRRHVKESVEHYRKLFPKAQIMVGGIYASLMPEDCLKYTNCDLVFQGVHKEAERFRPAYDLVCNENDLDYQIIHSSRGCIRDCEFCGIEKIEPKFTYKTTIKDEICSNKLVFYDNNLLANPYIENILEEIASAKWKGRPIYCESQCGFDGRLLSPKIAKLLKKARFRTARIAWDGPFAQYKDVKRQLDLLVEAGYSSRDIFIFMIYNWKIGFSEMEKKRKKCWEWKVQIADCRFRPVDQHYDNYKPRKAQTNNDYYIHDKWSDELVKKFRKNVRIQNICVRMGFEKYIKSMEDIGRRNRKIRKKIVLQMKQLGYRAPKVRQIEREEKRWIAAVRVKDEYFRVILASNLNINKVSKCN